MSQHPIEHSVEEAICHHAFIRTKQISKHGDIAYRYKIQGFWSHESVVLEIEADLQGNLYPPKLRWTSGGMREETSAPLAARNIAAAFLDAAELAEEYIQPAS